MLLILRLENKKKDNFVVFSKRHKFFTTIFTLIFWVSLVFLLNGCSALKKTGKPEPKALNRSSPPSSKPYSIYGKWYKPLQNSHGFKQRGIASWYGDKFHGKKTANGEIYNMHAMTAAHKTLPLGTVVSVRRLDNNKEITVRVNDRGPFVTGRIIDLSCEAAKRIGIADSGTTYVEIAVTGSSDLLQADSYDYNRGNFTFQVGSFRELANAENLKLKLEKKYQNVHIASYDNGYEIFYRVRVGKCSSLTQAAEYEKKLKTNGYENAIIVAE